MSYLQLYKASAGSGKTFILTKEYLKIAFEAPDKFRNILAVTFTNKAAEEMKGRVIIELNQLINFPDSSAYSDFVRQLFPHITNNQISSKALEIRDNILHNYSNFAIGTIDSFVQKMIRAFSFEIGVKSGYKIELDTEKVISDLVEMLYKKIDTDAQLQNWLIQFALHNIQEGRNWDFRNNLTELAYEIFKEKFQFFDENISKSTEAELKYQFSNFLVEMKNILFGFEKQMKEIGEKAKFIIQQHALNPADLGRNFNTICNHLTVKILFKSDYEPVKTIRDAINTIENWHAKSISKEKLSDIKMVFNSLNSLIIESVELYDNQYSNYLTAKNIIANFYSFGLLSDISKLLPQYRDQNNLLLITDTTLLLKKIISGNDAPFIYEKAGTRYKHILIDEFQDTSGFQWENFKPLIRNSLSNAWFSLIVGDIKQSIYRWRGGDWKLLLETVENEIGSSYIKTTSLDTNWRSKKNIIDFNNALFRYAPLIMQNNFNEEIEQIMDSELRSDLLSKRYNSILTDAYSDSYQHISPKAPKNGGRVKVMFFETGNRSQHKKLLENVMINLPLEIDNLLKNKNYSPKDITILVRRNIEGNEVIDMLLNYMNNTVGAAQYDIISSESLFLRNSSAVRIIVSALKYLYDNRDFVHLAALVYEYALINKRDISSDLFDVSSMNLNKLGEFLPDKFLEDCEMLSNLSLYELVVKLINLFELNSQIEAFPYIRAFEDLVLDFSKNNRSDLSKFIEWWNERGHKTAIQLSDKQDAVQVVTIHKSKGLAFKVVIIPFCDWKTEPASSFFAPIVWCEAKKEPFNQFGMLPIRFKKDLGKTSFAKDYFDEKIYSGIDALNMLYVAFTRAEEELIVYCSKTDSDTINSVSDLIKTSIDLSISEEHTETKHFVAMKSHFDSENLVLSIDDGYKEKDGDKFLREQKIENHFVIDDYPSSEWRDKIAIHYHSDEFFIESIEQIQNRVNHGILMHEIFSKIHTIEDIENALDEIYYTGKIDTFERAALKKSIFEIISLPEIANWFSNEWEIKTETALLTSKGEIRIPDRVIIKNNQAIVIDFKFGDSKAEHVTQVKEYMSYLAEMNFSKVEGFLFYVEQRKTIPVLNN